MMEKTIFDFELMGLNGHALDLGQFRGRAMLLVNTASACGFTPQYAGLETLWKQFGPQGLVVIAVPSNEFGGQEPGEADAITQTCQINYGVSFPVAQKSIVTGSGAVELYEWANAQAGFLGSPKWNFHKYLFDREGKFATWYSSITEPTSAKVVKAVERVLK